MPERFGTNEAIFDALRQLTLLHGGSAQPASGVPAPGSGGNKILLFRSDGSALIEYEPDEAGLNLALAAAVSGDTVWLPSIPISITAGVTVPAGVSLVGLSDNALINAAGFDGAALTLSDDATAMNFGLTLVGSGTDAIGVDASALRARVQHLDITVSGGSTRNVRVLTGATTVPQMIELWSKCDEGFVVWALCDGTVGSSPAWNTIAVPSGYAWAGGGDGRASSLAIDHQGHYLYIGGSDGNNGGRYTIWQLDNLAAIRAAPATSPSWSVIAYDTQVVSAGTLADQGGFFFMRCFGDTLYLCAKKSGGGRILGKYNGASWTWRQATITGADSSYHPINGEVYADLHFLAGDSYLRDWTSDAAIGSAFVQTFGIDHLAEIWRRYDAAGYYTLPYGQPDGDIMLREITTGTETEIGSTGSSNPQDAATVRGAWTSDAVYCVDSAGDLRVSSDSLAYSNVATWLRGWAMNTIIDGSGDLIWLVNSGISPSTVVRLYATDGTLLDDITGDLWTAIGSPAGAVVFENLWIVYASGSAGVSDYPLIADLHAGSATGTGAADIEVDGGAIVLDSKLTTLQADAGALVYVRDVSATTQTGTGTVEPLLSDRGVFDALDYQARHANDIDDAAGVHHTLGALDVIYQPLDDTLTAIAALADAEGQLTNDGAGNLSWVAVRSEVLMAEGVTPPDPLLTEDETDWLYTE